MMSEWVMMKLAEKLGKQTAHDLLHANAMRAFEEKNPLLRYLKKMIG